MAVTKGCQVSNFNYRTGKETHILLKQSKVVMMAIKNVMRGTNVKLFVFCAVLVWQCIPFYDIPIQKFFFCRNVVWSLDSINTCYFHYFYSRWSRDTCQNAFVTLNKNVIDGIGNLGHSNKGWYLELQIYFFLLTGLF